MEVRFDDKTITLTIGYIRAIKAYMKAEILMMRKVDSENVESWYCGSAQIIDLARSNGINFNYGSKEDCDRLRKGGQIFIEVPFLGLVK